MLVAMHQPYFAPYPGFYRKAAAADILVLLDSVQFPLGTSWLQRNRFKNHRGELWLTIPVRKRGLSGQRIDEASILWEGRWPAKHLQSLWQASKRAPFFPEHFAFLEDLYGQAPERLLELNLACIKHLAGHLGIETPFVLLSEIGATGRGTGLTLDICRRLGAAGLLVQAGALQHVDQEALRRGGLSLNVHRPRTVRYPQLWGPFRPNLSSFDLLFSCGPKSKELLFGRGLE